jgi:hypothetical protein
MKDALKTNEPQTFKLPPAGFNPITASDTELKLYGIVSRPNPKTDPDNYKLWESVFSKKLEYMPLKIKERKEIQASSVKPFTSGDNFAGVQISNSDNFNYIVGTWTIPQIAFPGFSTSLPNLPEHGLDISVSLGTLLLNRLVNPIVFGTQQIITEDSVRRETTTLTAFFTVQNGPLLITVTFEIDIKPGDSVTCLICINSNPTSGQGQGQASFSLVNNTTSKYYALGSATFHPVNLSCARWGLSNAIGDYLAQYNNAQHNSTIQITSAQCGGLNSQAKYETLNCNVGTPSNYSDPTSQAITSTAKIVGPESISITFTNMLKAS